MLRFGSLSEGNGFVRVRLSSGVANYRVDILPGRVVIEKRNGDLYPRSVDPHSIEGESVVEAANVARGAYSAGFYAGDRAITKLYDLEEEAA